MVRMMPPMTTTLINARLDNWLPRLDDESKTGVMAMPNKIMAMRYPGAVFGPSSVLRIQMFPGGFERSGGIEMAGIGAPASVRGDVLLVVDQPGFGLHAQHLIAVAKRHLADRETS